MFNPQKSAGDPGYQVRRRSHIRRFAIRVFNPILAQGMGFVRLSAHWICYAKSNHKVPTVHRSPCTVSQPSLSRCHVHNAAVHGVHILNDLSCVEIVKRGVVTGRERRVTQGQVGLILREYRLVRIVLVAFQHRGRNGDLRPVYPFSVLDLNRSVDRLFLAAPLLLLDESCVRSTRPRASRLRGRGRRRRRASRLRRGLRRGRRSCCRRRMLLVVVVPSAQRGRDSDHDPQCVVLLRALCLRHHHRNRSRRPIARGRRRWITLRWWRISLRRRRGRRIHRWWRRHWLRHRNRRRSYRRNCRG